MLRFSKMFYITSRAENIEANLPNERKIDPFFILLESKNIDENTRVHQDLMLSSDAVELGFEDMALITTETDLPISREKRT